MIFLPPRPGGVLTRLLFGCPYVVRPPLREERSALLSGVDESIGTLSSDMPSAAPCSPLSPGLSLTADPYKTPNL